MHRARIATRRRSPGPTPRPRRRRARAPTPTPTPAAPPAPVVDAAPPSDAAASVDEPFGEAGASACRLVWGPAEQPFRGPAALDVAGHELRMIVNDGGRPRAFSVAIPPVPPKNTPPFVPPRPTAFVGVRWPGCELAGKFVYCPTTGGEITRATLGPNGPTDVKTVTGAKAAASTRLAAAPLGADHSVVAWLEKHKTTEGDMLQAFVSLDDRVGQRLSDEGAGATTMRFFARKGTKARPADQAVAVYLDTRTAMVPIHARTMTLKESELSLAPDVVLSVGGVPERGVDLEVAPIGERALAFIPMPRDTLEFGMAMVAVDDPPKENVPTKWSLYPNGLDPAPMGAAPSRDGKTAWIVRMRPREKAVGSPKILELGKVDADGAFASLGEIAVAAHVTDVLVIEDTLGAVWILYGDSTITWLERRACD
ncbi:MAG: hypothetical protein KIT84_17775 [Labilithrix sp.]|nr:hypothetical protein [Labilithrix sp.]